MVGIVRDPQAAAGRRHDVAIVGGGIYGAMLLYEAARHGLDAVLVEKDDFGGATSLNNFRILHGGLRYLQQLDLPRFFESVAERRWFLQNFPDLTAPVGCLMPLYGRGARTPAVFRLALAVNAALSVDRNRGVPRSRHLPAGHVLTARAVMDAFPQVRRRGLRGGALWFDGLMPDPQRIQMTLLRAACAAGAIALNYAEARAPIIAAGAIRGIRIADRITGTEHELAADHVVNATGPWAAQTAALLGTGRTELFIPTLAWNILFDRPAVAPHALAIEPEGGGQILFLLPWKGRLLAGTGHAPWSGPAGHPRPAAGQLAGFIDQLNRAAPELRLAEDQVARVFCGLLPGSRRGAADLSDRPQIIDHATAGGPRGLISVVGVKYTTARAVARRVLRPMVAGARPCRDLPLADHILPADPVTADTLRRLCTEEAVQHLDDLILRRGDFTRSGAEIALCARVAANVLGWSEEARRRQIDRLTRELERAGFAGHEVAKLAASRSSGPG